jgi:hypothetical protein
VISNGDAIRTCYSLSLIDDKLINDAVSNEKVITSKATGVDTQETGVVRSPKENHDRELFHITDVKSSDGLVSGAIPQ